MIFLARIFIFSLVCFVNPLVGQAQNQDIPVETISSPSMIPAGNMLIPSMLEENKVSPQDIPSILIPLTENLSESDIESNETLDSHVIIESVPTVIEAIEDVKAVTPHAFNRIKQLAGRWEGSGAGQGANDEKQEKVTVVYEITSGGYAVLEKIFPGTSQEMITVYYDNKGKLTLSHFFMIGTRSLMTNIPAKQGNEAVFDFKLVDNPELDPEVDTHMHSLQIAFVDENHMNQTWTMYEAGKQSGTYTFKLTRVLSEN